ncbi:MAG: hypothetical protein IPL46_30565 [Saprospiraceae bacterium]|nr:hypothetical protein [Saprospiraceae bacterium]
MLFTKLRVRALAIALALITLSIGCEKESDIVRLDSIDNQEYDVHSSEIAPMDEALNGLADFFVQVSQNNLLLNEMQTLSSRSRSYKMPVSVAEAIRDINEFDLSSIKKADNGNAREHFDWQKLVEDNPTIDIEIPDFKDFPRKDWSFDKVEKIVVVDSKTKGREDVEFYDVYDVATGKKEKLSAAVPPGSWVMILKESDHKIAIDRNSGKSLHGNRIEVDPDKFLYSSGKYDVYTIVDVFLEYSDEPSGIPDDNNSHARSCLRDRTSNDYISKIRAVSYYGLNQWAETNVIIQSDYGWTEFFPPSTWSPQKANKVWYAQKIDFGHNGSVWDHYLNSNGLGTEIFEWDNATISSRMTYNWMEIDEPDTELTNSFNVPSGTVKYTVNGIEYTQSSPSQTTTYKTTPKNDPLGAATVTYCDNSSWPGTQYNTGSLLFWVGD